MIYRSPLLTSLLFALLAAACGAPPPSDTADTTTSTGTKASTGAQPPAPGPLHAPDGTQRAVFAITRLYVGDTDRDSDSTSVDAWRQYGFNLDQRLSEGTSTGLCKPRAGARAKHVHPDGKDGIDNSFGENLLPLVTGLAPGISARESRWIAEGRSTILFDLEDLGPGAAYNPLTAHLHVGADRGGAPRWDGDDLWPITREAGSAEAQVASGYLVGNTWVGRPPDGITITLHFDHGLTLDLPIQSAVVTMDLDPTHESARNGTIAGVIPTDALLASVQQTAVMLDPSLCSNPTLDTILQLVEQTSDILQDGSQDPARECDGVSIGLGFEAHTVKLGPIAPPPPPRPRCP